MNSNRRGDNRATSTCFGKSRQCAMCTFFLGFSTLIFITNMILTVYLTHIGSMDKAFVVLIVGSCLLYILGFISNMYTICYCKPNNRQPENSENSNRLSQIINALSQSSSTNGRPPDTVGISRARELLRKTPPPPYDVPMSVISRRPGTSRTAESSTRKSEIAEEARKLIKRMYDEIVRTDQQRPQSSRNEQSMQEMVQMPKTPVRQQETRLPKVSDQNLVVQKRKTTVKNSPGTGLPQVGFRSNQGIQQKVTPTQNDLERLITGSKGCSTSPAQLSPHIPGRLLVESRTNEVVQQKVTPSSISTQLDLGRLIIGSEGCSATRQQQSPRISGRPSVNFGTNEVIQHKAIQNSLQTQPGLERFIIGSDGCVAAPSQLSPRRQDFLKLARKRKLTSTTRKLLTTNKGNVLNEADDNDVSQNNVYEEIEVRSIQRTNSAKAVNDSVEYYCDDSEFEDGSEQSSSVSSATASGPAETKRKFGAPSVQVRRKISALATTKFCQLEQSPETYLDAVATCFDLTPDEWKLAWKLSQQDIPPSERARILGLRLHEDSYVHDY